MQLPYALKRTAVATLLLFCAHHPARAGNEATCRLEPKSENCVYARLLERAVEDEAYDGYEVFRLHIGPESYEFRRGRDGRIILDAFGGNGALRTFFYFLDEDTWRDVVRGWKRFRLDVAATYKDRFVEESRGKPVGTFVPLICTHYDPVDFEVALAGEEVIRMAPQFCGEDYQTEHKVQEFVIYIKALIARSVPFCHPFAAWRINTCFLLEGNKLLAGDVASSYLDLLDACADSAFEKLSKFVKSDTKAIVTQDGAVEYRGPTAISSKICHDYGYFDTTLIEGRADGTVVVTGSAGFSIGSHPVESLGKIQRLDFTQIWKLGANGTPYLAKWEFGEPK